MALGWSVAGRRVEFAAALPAGKIVVKENGQVVHEQKLAATGAWGLDIAGEAFLIKRTRAFLVQKLDLFSAQGERVPPTPKHVAPSPAAPGSLCAAHQAAARHACARCGTFVCSDCGAPDRTHCKACSARLIKEAEKNAAAAVYMVPAAFFGILGGLLLAVLGIAAGAAAVAIARQTESKALKIVAAIGLYGVALIIWVVLVAMLQR